jgi:glycosyltransferase involved in cell wall biosynthesis
MVRNKLVHLDDRIKRYQKKGNAYTKIRTKSQSVNEAQQPPPAPRPKTQKVSTQPIDKPKEVNITLKDELSILVSAPIYYNGSFGVVGRGIVEALSLSGAKVGFDAWKEGDRSIPLKDIIKKAESVKVQNPDIFIRVSHPDSFDVLQSNGKYKIGVGVTEERELRFPKWIKYANSYCDQVWLPSNFCKRTFDNAGVVNTHVVPNGFDPAIFNSRVPKMDYGTDNFVFLFLGVSQIRKGVHLLIDAFTEEFGENEATLVIKTMDWGQITSPRKNIKIEHSNQGVPEMKMGSFYTGADAFVLPTRAEGFGMPILEAMACKLPVIVTNYSGHLDFCNNKNSYLIECDNYETRMFRDDPNAMGAEPNKEHLKWLMRFVYENRYETSVIKKIDNAYGTSQGFTWEKIGHQMIKLISILEPDAFIEEAEY